MPATESRERFAYRLELHSRRGNLRLFASDGHQYRTVLGLSRRARYVHLYLSKGFGFTIHRNGGFSLPGIPRNGGTSVLWGAANRRVRELGRDHRAFHLGPIGIYIGPDF